MKIKSFKLKDLRKHLEANGIWVKLPFTATNFKCSNDPKIKFKDGENKDLKWKLTQKGI